MLKDELGSEEDTPKEIVFEETDAKSVSVEEADSFISLKRKQALPNAIGTALCVLSPIPLILLAGLSEFTQSGISEDMAGGFGVVILLAMVAAGVAVLVLNSAKLEKYAYLEKENLLLQYGVRGIVGKKREEFGKTYGICVTTGTVLCILGVVPLMIAAAFSARDLVYIYCVVILLAIVAAGVFLFVWAGTIKDSFDILLQEGEYTVEEKMTRNKISFFPGAYWCLVVAVFLAFGFRQDDWKSAAYVWPVAALLFVVIWLIVRAIAKAGVERRNRDR